MKWQRAQRGKTLHIEMSVEGGPSEVRAAARHLWAVFQVDVIPPHREMAWDEVRIDLRLSGMCWVYPASSVDAGMEAQVIVGLEIPAMRETQDELSEAYWDEATEDFRDGHDEAHRACLEPYARAILDAIPRSGWQPELAEAWHRAGGTLVCIADGDDHEEALAEQSLHAEPIGTVASVGPFKTHKPIAAPAQVLPIAEGRAKYIVDLVSDAWVDGLDEAVMGDPVALRAASAEREALARDFVDTAIDPHELQCFADACNPNSGVAMLRRVTDRPACDAGTALSVYWRLRPEFFLQYETPADVPESEREDFALLEAIERRFADGAYGTRLIPYDPNRRGMVGLYAEQVAVATRCLPPVMYAPV